MGWSWWSPVWARSYWSAAPWLTSCSGSSGEPTQHFTAKRLNSCRGKCCENCFKLEISLVLCPSCELISYCSAACLEEDRSDHRLECAIMEDLSQLADITRITARLLLKLEEGGDLQCEPLPFSQGERCFRDLLSHADKIEEADLCARQIFHSLTELIPAATGAWQHFKQVYGKLIINSFEISGDYDEKLGWALYLGPSILDHSCVPSAEVDFKGKNILIKSKVNMVDIDLRKIFISYIDLGDTTAVRRSKLRTNYHFSCLCDRCTGIKLSWVISEPLNEKLRDILLQENCLATAIEENARGQDKEYLSSVRCQKCSGRPVHVSQVEVVAVCRAFKEVVSLVYAQIAKIDAPTCVRLFRHCVEDLFKYLSFEPL